jgi:uncharacterized OB-fold protein
MQDDDFFWDGVNDGRLLFQRCADCSTLRHPPGPMCPNCQSLRWEPQAASGRAKVFAWLLSRHPNNKSDAAPRIVSLLELEEGIRFVSNLQDIELADIYQGMPVEVFYQDIDGKMLPQFRPAKGAEA